MPLKDYRERYRTPIGEIKEGEARITDFWNRIGILYFAQKMPGERKKSGRLFLDCGDDDEILYRGNALLHIALRDA